MPVITIYLKDGEVLVETVNNSVPGALTVSDGWMTVVTTDGATIGIPTANVLLYRVRFND